MKPDPEIYLALAQLLPELKGNPAHGVDQDAVADKKHRQAFDAALNGDIPAERINGRWYVKRADLPKIAKLLGVMPKPRIGRPPRDQASSSSSSTAALGLKLPAAPKPARAKRAVPPSIAATA